MLRSCCQDKISPYDIRPSEAGLIGAAIGLAEWLLKHEIGGSQRFAISEMLAFLRNLPEPPPVGLNGEFGFEFQPIPEEPGGEHAGVWVVSVCRGMFEIISSGCEPLAEFSWELCPGQLNRNDLSHAGEWVEQVAEPYRGLPEGHRLVVEAATWAVTPA
ncbi:hypothetical protein FQZ97_591210 [compost metagenome]